MKQKIKDRKHFVRALLDRLPLHQKQVIMGWLTTGGPGGEGITYKEAQKRIAEQFGVKISQQGIFKFFHRNRRKAPSKPIETTIDAEKITIVIHLRK